MTTPNTSPQNVPRGIVNTSTQHSPVVEPTYSIVIAGRNSAAFLEEAISSAFAQTLKPKEIIYVDDCSYDNSLDVASAFVPRGLVLLSSGTHHGVCHCRNRGLSAATGEYVIFMDSDDKLPVGFTTWMIESARCCPAAPFHYPNTKCFGASDQLWKNVPWQGYDIWQHNQVSTTSMWRRDVVNAVGGWHELPTMWDYDLAIRCSRYGTPQASKATLDYRIHGDSQSVQLDERQAAVAIQYKELIRRKNATLGIGCLYSGRLPGLFPKWISKVACSVRYWQSRLPSHPSWSLPPRKAKLHILLHSPAVLDRRECDRYSDTLDITFGFIDDVIDRRTEFARRNSVCRLLANACQKMQDQLNTDITWFVEDDIIVPLGGCHELFTTLTQHNDPVIGVSGTYYNRHIEGQLLGGWIQHGRHCEPSTHFRPVDKVDFVGTGCLMYWSKRPGTPKRWRPLTTINEPGATAHDWAWSEEVKGNLVVLGTVVCDHHKSETEFV